MKRAFALLLLTTTVGAGSMLLAGGQGLYPVPETHLTSRPAPGADLILIDDDEDDEGWLWSRWNEDDDDDDDDDDEDDDCDDDDEGGKDCASGATGNAAKAGTVAPPKNGLFTDGTAPVVKSN
jgi:hypothetical protein